MELTKIKASLLFVNLPEGTILCNEYAVKTDLKPLGAALIKHTNTERYALLADNAISSCNQNEAKKYDESLTDATFSAQIQNAIAATGKTMKEVSDLIGVPYRTIQDYRAGRHAPSSNITKEAVLTKINALK